MNVSTYYYGPALFRHPLEDYKVRVPQSSFACDVFEDPNSFTIYAELPGVSKDAINVSIEKNIVQIQALKPDIEPEAKDSESEIMHLHERASGQLTRSFKLPSSVDTDCAKSTFENGVLKIVFGKDASYAVSRKIEIH